MILKMMSFIGTNLKGMLRPKLSEILRTFLRLNFPILKVSIGVGL